MKKTEDQVQNECVKWFRNTYLKKRNQLFSVPNGGKRNFIEATKLKATGLVAGIPDLIFVNAGKTIFFELKTEKGVLSDKQKLIHYTFLNEGFPVYLIRSFEQFKEVLNLEMNLSDRSIPGTPKQRIFNLIRKSDFDQSFKINNEDEFIIIKELLSLDIERANMFKIEISTENTYFTKVKRKDYGN